MKHWSRATWTLAITSIAVYLVSLDVTIVNVGFRAIVEDLGPDRVTLLTWVFSGYSIAFAAGLLTAGRLADRLGRKRIFLLGIVVFGIGSVLCGLAPTAEILVASRIVQAVGGALVLPASIALLLLEFPVEKRTMAIGINGAVGGVAAATGPAIGGVIVDQASWHWLFLVNIPLCAVAVWLGRRHLVESRADGTASRPDVAGAALAMASVALFVLAIIQGEEWGWTSAGVIGSIAGSIVLGVGVVVRCRTHPDPVLDLALFRLRFVTAANLATLLFSMGFFAMFFVNVQFLQGVWQYSTIASGLATVPGPLMAGAFAVPAGKWAQRRGHARVIVAGTGLLATGIALLGVLAGTEARYWAMYLPVQLVTGIGVGLSISTLGSAANAFLPPNRFAMGSAVNSTARQVGGAVGIAAVAAILASADDAADPLTGFHRSWVFIVVTVATSGAVMAVLFRRPTATEVDASRVPAAAPATVGPG
jgi:EmrB/QacA subfamily drug resistance transporter